MKSPNLDWQNNEIFLESIAAARLERHSPRDSHMPAFDSVESEAEDTKIPPAIKRWISPIRKMSLRTRPASQASQLRRASSRASLLMELSLFP